VGQPEKRIGKKQAALGISPGRCVFLHFFALDRGGSIRNAVGAGARLSHGCLAWNRTGGCVPRKVEESVPKPYYTADMVREMPDDGNRYELVYGELLVTPTPRVLHQVVVTRLSVALTQYAVRHRTGYVFGVPGDITWGRTDVLVQPDLFVAPVEEVRTNDWEQVRSLTLVVEVLSPSSMNSDRFTKRRRYQDAGVPLYWVVDADQQRVEIWTPDDSFPRIERDRLIWHPAGAGEPFTLELQELFQPV
jgi:Uma2 family endonuclease